MGRARGHIEGSRRHNRPGPCQRHAPGQLREAQIKADAQAQLAKRRVKNRDTVSGGEGLRLHKPLAALDIDIEKVHLPMERRLTARRVEDKGCIVYSLAVRLGHGPGHQPEARLPGQPGHGPMDRPARRFGVGPKGLVGIETAEHLRQDGQLGPAIRRPADIVPGHGEVLRLVSSDGHLNQRSAHPSPSFSDRT